MNRIMIMMILASSLVIGCQKQATELPNHPDQLIIGEWQLAKFKAKTYRGKLQIGGQKIDTEQTLSLQPGRFIVADNLGAPVSFGRFEIKEDSIILTNEMDSTEVPGRFRIQHLSANKLELLDTQTDQTRIGELYSEGVYYYER